MIDLIIPILDEELYLREHEQYFVTLSQKVRLYFVDGGSRDQSVRVAAKYGTVLHSSPGRAIQKNYGAQHADADYMLFLHVDSHVQPETLAGLEIFLKEHNTQAACFTLRIDDPAWIFRFFERMINIRAKYFGVIDGDIGLFITQELFRRVGGFDQVPIMEDILIAKKIRKLSRVKVLDDIIQVSPRRWYEDGFWTTLSFYLNAYFKLWFGLIRKREAVL